MENTSKAILVHPMDEIYRENILDHFKHPRNFGTLDQKSNTASDDLVSCGDKLSLELLVDKQGKVEAVAWYGKGCAISMSAASMLSEYIKGKSVSVLKQLKKDDILDMLGVGLTPTRLKCALLSLEVLHKALKSVK
jgi:nitrogen fixation NifU-like protein